MWGAHMVFSRRNPSSVERSIKRVLVIEDEPLVAFDNEYALEQAGFDVVATVDRADAALPFLADGRADAVVLDYNLAAGQNGLIVAQEAIKRGIPVLFVSGDLPETAHAYATAWLAKPYTATSLVAALRCLDAIGAGRAPGDCPAELRLFAQTA